MPVTAVCSWMWIPRRVDDRQLAAAGQVDTRVHLRDLGRGHDVRLDAVGAIQEGLVTLHLERVPRMTEIELALGREQQIEVELLTERPPDSEARLVERDCLRRVVVGPHDLRVAPRAAAADVARVEDRHVRDAVARRQVVRQGQAVDAAADDHDVIGRLQLMSLEEGAMSE